jgi:hypothetical protein
LRAPHVAYGLRLEANLPIPGLPLQLDAQPTDVEICLGERSLSPIRAIPSAESLKLIYTSPGGLGPEVPCLRMAMDPSEKYYVFFYRDGARFAVERHGREVWADWPEDYTLEDACTYLLGPVMGFVLRLRGVICLHASAIVTGAGAIALAGPAGAGKSTLAAAFGSGGFPVLSDDVVALVDEGEGFLVQPGYPRVNLWPDSARALFGLENPLPQITPTWDKQYLALDENGCPFAMEPSVLRAIYVLGEREAGMDEAIIEEVPGSEAFMMLVANSYVNYLLDRDMRSEEFAMFGRISSEIPIRRIRPTTNHEDIRNLCGDIVTNAMSLVTPAWPPVLPYCR